VSAGPEEVLPSVPANELVRVVRGEPDEVELAALVAGIFAAVAGAGDDEAAAPPPAAWSDHTRRLGTSPTPGPATWRWSGRR
jgi:hypothetical protein